MRPTKRPSNVWRTAKNAYEFTAPLISKWHESSDGRMYVMGAANTRVAWEMNHHMVAESYRRIGVALRARTPSPLSSSDEGRGAREFMLRSRGINPLMYAASYQRDPEAALLLQSQFDKRR